MAVLRQDKEGLYLKADGYQFRPGSVNGYGHAYRMDDGGLQAGQKVPVRHVGGTPLARIFLPDGTKTFWFAEESRKGKLEAAPADAKWDKDGKRIFDPVPPSLDAEPQYRQIHTRDGVEIERVTASATLTITQ